MDNFIILAEKSLLTSYYKIENTQGLNSFI